MIKYIKRKQEYLFKSNINIFIFMVYEFFVYLLTRIILDISEKEFYKYSIIFLAVFLTYVGLCIFINQFYFLENEIEIFYFFRIKNRKKKLMYEDVQKVKYYHTLTRFGHPTIQLLLLNKSNNFSRPSNSFILHSFKKRKSLLIYLLNKGLIVENHSLYKDEEDILL
jgi:hypothetical protein